jgi:hypothetical protein
MLTDRPIPGQSLTTPSQSQPYERQPEVTNAIEALEYHMDRLNEPEAKEEAMDLLEMDIDIVTLTEGVLRKAVMDGIHSIDISVSIAPHLHEFIKGEADALGIEYDEGFDDVEKEKEMREGKLGGKALMQIMKEDPMVESDNLEQAIPTEEQQPMQEEPQDEMSTEVGAKGLMAREIQ